MFPKKHFHDNRLYRSFFVTDAPVVIIRVEEVVLVVLVLVIWVGAIALFFNRWGKIRMLEPYQPKFHQPPHRPSCPLAPLSPPGVTNQVSTNTIHNNNDLTTFSTSLPSHHPPMLRNIKPIVCVLVDKEKFIVNSTEVDRVEKLDSLHLIITFSMLCFNDIHCLFFEKFRVMCVQ